MTGIEPAYSAWEADVLPLNYIGAVASEINTIDSAGVVLAEANVTGPGAAAQDGETPNLH